jgi:hypothetical protein
MENFDTLLNEIKENYQFQNDNELADLLKGLADPEHKGVTYWDYIEVDTLLSLQSAYSGESEPPIPMKVSQ